MARILSIDYGKKRTGLAVTDPLQIIPNGLATVVFFFLFSFITSYVGCEEFELKKKKKLKQMNGEPSENHARVVQFVERWRKVFPNIPIELYDERFTSVLAHRTIIDSGIGRKARRNKALVDEISATIILQSYLDYIQDKKL